jgi:HK97 family phage portal protein
MTIIQSEMALSDMPANWWPHSTGGVTLYDNIARDYATLYKTQPNVRVCVDFLSRNVAQLGLHVFRISEDGNRERVRDHPIARILEKPMPPEFKMSRYRMLETLMGDLGVYSNAFWKKVITDGKVTALLRLPPQSVSVKGNLYPSSYVVTLKNGSVYEVPGDEIVHFRTYNAMDPKQGLSPLETLRQILAEEAASATYRENYWKNSARMSGVINRPSNAVAWSDEARERFRQEWKSLYTGPESSGATAILEDGMEFEPTVFNAKESEYLEGRKLTREEAARAFHIPPPLVGILDHATYSNIREQHKQLYQDVLGPWLSLIEDDIELQLLPDFEETKNLYVEFNLKEKLKGDFEEQTKSLQSAVGRAWLTVNEARQLMNYPLIEGGDEIVTPLNVITGAQANPRDSAPDEPSDEGNPKSNSQRGLNKQQYESYIAENKDLWDSLIQRWQRILTKTFMRQRDSILPKVKARAASETKMYDINSIWDEERWNEELVEDTESLAYESIYLYAEDMAKALGYELDEDSLRSFASNSSNVVSRQINSATREDVEAALEEEDPASAIDKLFKFAIAVRVGQLAHDWLHSLSQGGYYLSGRSGGVTKKTWHVTSRNPRKSHAQQDGVTVDFYDTFPNGNRFPGDPFGPAEENANCMCILEYHTVRR